MYMQELQTFLIIIGLTLINCIYGQFQPNLCAYPLNFNLDPRWRQIPSRFEIMTELVEVDGIAEVSQAFSPVRDSIAFNARGGEYLFLNFLMSN